MAIGMPMPQSTPSAKDALRGPDTTGGQEAAMLFAARIGLYAPGVLIQGLLAWLLLPEGRGSYAVCLVFGNLLSLLFTPGAQSGARYFVMARQASVSQGVASALTISLAGGGLAIVLATPMIHSDMAFFQKAETRSFHLALVLVPLTAFSFAVEHQLAALRRFGRLAIFLLLQAWAYGLAILVLVWRLGLGVDGAIAAFAASHLVMIAACLLDLRRHCGLVPEMPSRSAFTGILGYGLRDHVARIGGAVEQQIGILALGLIASRADVGLFAAASAIMLRFNVISSAVGGALLPRISSGHGPELTARCLRLVCGATAAALPVLLAISTLLVQLLLSDAFLPAVPLLWIIAPGILAYAGGGIFMAHFQGVNRPDICSWAVGFGWCVNLGALVLLYPRLGAAAAAWAMTIGLLGRCLLLAIVFGRTTTMGWLSIWFPRRSDARFLWAAGRSALSHPWRSR